MLREAGWQVRYFGPNLPLEYAMVSAMNWKPDVIGLSLSLAYQLPKLKEYVSTLESLHYNPKVLVGGRVASMYDLSPYCSDRTVTIPDLTSFRQWLQNYDYGKEMELIGG